MPIGKGEEGEKFVGIASDGRQWIAYELDDGNLIKITEISLDLQKSELFLAWLDGVVALRASLPPNPLTIRIELGQDSVAFRRAGAALASLWGRLGRDAGVALKRQLWAQLLKLVYGREVESDALWLGGRMVRARNKLTARTVAALAEPGKHSDGGGLYLRIDGDGGANRRRWIFRFAWRGRTKEMGLGGYPEVSLADARMARGVAEQSVHAGQDPIEARRKAARTEAGKPTFGQMAEALIEAKASEWRNAKHRAQWKMTLEHYAAPLRSRSVDEIDTAAVLAVLTPLWREKPETASRLRGRIEAVLDAAKAQGHRSGENPAAWRGHLSHLLPKRGKLSRGHHAAMAYQDVPAFIERLREREAIAALALEFCILTAARSGEVLGARWSEIDISAKIWAVPAGRMKAAREHRLPLSDRVLAIVEKAVRGADGRSCLSRPTSRKNRSR